ncbi:uncharacterized protein LOC119326664 [Triticum dicoccoides]|uniref:uncharacterized protein LOC119326664 n=1 Tax=Triticum dicoccoides TaxID=85692 RepID=UPI001890CA0B|nr:uncharacterized protein LOC119326664 [Triticum dicoccoides]
MYCKLSLRDPDNYSVHAATQSNCIRHLSATSYTFATLCPAIHRVVQPQGHVLRKSPEAKLLSIAIDHEASLPCCYYYMSTDGHMRSCGHTFFEGVSPCNCTFFPGPLRGAFAGGGRSVDNNHLCPSCSSSSCDRLLGRPAPRRQALPSHERSDGQGAPAIFFPWIQLLFPADSRRHEVTSGAAGGMKAVKW